MLAGRKNIYLRNGEIIMRRKSLFTTLAVATLVASSVVFTGCGDSTSTGAASQAENNEQSSSGNALDIVFDSKPITVKYGDTLKASDIPVSLKDGSAFKVTFKDGTTEKSYKSLGEYKDTFTITSNGKSRDVYFTVNVADTTVPTFSGIKAEITASKGASDSSLLEGVKAVDDVDGDVTSSIKVTGFDNEKIGDQVVTFVVSDKAGNAATKTVTVTIAE